MDVKRTELTREIEKLAVWHADMNVRFVLPESLRRRCLDGIANNTGPVAYYQRVLRNNARYWQLSALLDGEE